jgi:hypothetical protein
MLLILVLARKRRLDLVTVRAVTERRRTRAERSLPRSCLPRFGDNGVERLILRNHEMASGSIGELAIDSDDN